MGLRRTNTAEGLREVIEREHPRDSAGLLAQLRGGDAEQRRWAARDLAHHPATAGALGEQLLREGDARVREALFSSLILLAGDTAAGALMPLLRSEDVALRNGAIEALAAMPQAVGPQIDALLRDGDPDVRIFTVNLLGALRHAQVPAWLLRVLQHETEANVVGAALEVLVEVGSPEHLPALRAARARFADDPFIGFAADLALQRIESP